MAIISTSDYKTWRGLSGSTYDTILGVLITGAQARAERYCGRTFDSATFTEVYNGSGSDILVLKNTPITSITSLKILDADGTVVLTIPSTTYGFEAATGVVKLASDVATRFDLGEESLLDCLPVWARAPVFGDAHQNVQAVYVGGYSTHPADLKLAMYQFVDELFARSPGLSAVGGSGPSAFESERLGDYQYQRPGTGDVVVVGDSVIDTVFAKFKSLFLPFRRGAA